MVMCAKREVKVKLDVDCGSGNKIVSKLNEKMKIKVEVSIKRKV